jgi:hypothetical protein
MNKMKTLIIHPKDETTDFLKSVYRNIEVHTLITEKNKNEKEFKEIISDHDRLIMMGHGFPAGLYSTPDRALIITDEHAKLFKDKDCVFIWCNADRYVQKHELKGFYTGMIISEVAEADYCEVPASQNEVNESNYLFAETIGRYINNSESMHRYIISEYNSSRNPVIIYNQERIYSNI